jgi:hypothetical protein
MFRKIALFILSGVLLAAPLLHGQNEAGSGGIQVFSGTVTDIDWPGRKITVIYRDPNTDITKSLSLSVPADAVFKRESEDMDFSDVELQDQVEIEYTGDPLVNPVLKVLNDLNLEND